MLFNTIDFVVFLPVVVIFYYLIPSAFRWILLLAASYIFYMSWNPYYIFLILFSTAVDYLLGIRMEYVSNKRNRLPYLLLSIAVNLGLLFTFKYLDFATNNANSLLQKLGFYYQIPFFELLLPVGISFYTFQTLSYAIDIYNGKIRAERHFGYFALYVSFFPQLVAGPIERFSSLSPQFKKKHSLTYENFANGLRLILYGLFIKMVIADNISGPVDHIFAEPEKFHALDVLTGMGLYSFQIYSDFYGYSLIAIGSALLLGIRLMDNFKTPYLAKNIAEFWQRWHISLSTWFRDYVYYPLGGKRTSTNKWIRNIVLVFILSGIWHGANWTFIFWGGLYAIIYLIEKLLNRLLNKKEDDKPFSPKHILLAIKTFILVSIIWVFFRSPTLLDAMAIFNASMHNWTEATQRLNIPSSTIIFFILFLISDIAFYNTRFDKWVATKTYVLRWSIYAILIFAITVFAGIENAPFIYFQF
jgi:D-alanyl-lipoteichoic acid acyltransferase DltB (MBOAT superfamily)